jgi:hypothetical protein
MKAKNGIWSGRRVLVTGGIFFKPSHSLNGATDCTARGSIACATQRRPDAAFPQVVEVRVVEERHR